MSFIGSVISAVVDVIVSIVEAVIQVIEVVIQLIMILLGFDGGSTQIVEYYEVHNVPLFDDVDKKNPLLQSVIQSILQDQDIASNLIYHTTFRSLKGNVKEFMQFIDNGNYFEGFPTIESYILVIDYDELTAALNTLNGVPCTPEGSFLRALTDSDWIKYWLQENKAYNVGTNTIGVDYSTTSEDTVTVTPSTNNFDIDIIGEIVTTEAGTINSVAIDADTVTVTPSTNHFDIDITSEIASSDTVKAISSSIGSRPVQVNLNTIAYNSGADNYTVQVYNAADLVLTLPYTVPSKPTQLHYVSTYYRDSAPSRQYLFIYKVGTGTYTDLDTVEDPIDMDGATLETLPAVPLRISNANYTTFGATKQAQIEDLLSIIHLDAEEILDAVLNDPGVAGDLGDVDNIYVNFGVRMWDTSQAGMSYLYTMFENLYPSQGVTQGTYNNSPGGDTKPQNNILTTTEDNKSAFQFSYITYEHTSLADINADSGSVENGIYYSDMSRFDADDLLVNRYFVSSGKGTYNVGYKADDLDEVQDFLDGSGVPNPGTTTGEATNWLQVTERMVYNNPSPTLLEADDSASDIIYLTPDLVYENNGSGTLRLVEQASEATTVGQSITYYCCKVSGLDAYTVVAPISALKVIDGDSGHFRMVKFNLGNKPDLMVPFIHTFIKDLSNQRVSQLFLAGAHVSIYIAHYEVIHHAGMSFLEALVMIIIIVVIVYLIIVTAGAAGGTLGPIIAAIGAQAYALAVSLIVDALINLAIRLVVSHIIKLIITEIAGDNETLALLLNIVAMVAMSAYGGKVSDGTGAPPGTVQPNTFSHTGGADIGVGGGSIEFTSAPKSFHFTNMTSFSFSSLTAFDYANIAFDVVTGLNTIALHQVQKLGVALAEEKAGFEEKVGKTEAELAGYQTFLEPLMSPTDLSMIIRATNTGGAVGGHQYFALFDAQYEIQYTSWAYSETMNNKISNSAMML